MIMLDIKLIRSNPEILKKAMAKRKESFDVKALIDLDEKRRQILTEVEKLKNKQNEASRQIPKFKKEGKDISSLMDEMKSLSDKIKALDGDVRNIDDELNKILLTIPNIPHGSVPEGDTDEDNVEVRRWGEPSKFEFDPKPHWEIGENLDILDFSTAAKLPEQDLPFIKAWVQGWREH